MCLLSSRARNLRQRPISDIGALNSRREYADRIENGGFNLRHAVAGPASGVIVSHRLTGLMSHATYHLH